AGILVDTTVLDLEGMEPGVLYVYESVFSGKVFGFEYSKVLPIDHPVPQDGYHLGPQVRKFVDVLNDSAGEVAVCPLSSKERARLSADPEALKRIVTDFHGHYWNWSYPLAPIKQYAAASDKLYKNLQYLKSQGRRLLVPFIGVPGHKRRDEAEHGGEHSDSVVHRARHGQGQYVRDRGTVFCSELVALLYSRIGLPDFISVEPEELTPVEVEVMPSFGGRCLMIKSGDRGVLLEPDGRTLIHQRRYNLSTIMATLEHADIWRSSNPAAGSGEEQDETVPTMGSIGSLAPSVASCSRPAAPPADLTALAAPQGVDADGVPLYIARVRIGLGVFPGSARLASSTIPTPSSPESPTSGPEADALTSPSNPTLSPPRMLRKSLTSSTTSSMFSNPGALTTTTLKVPWEGEYLKVTYEHEVLTSLQGLLWQPCASTSDIPSHALLGGRTEDGDQLFIARADVSRRRAGGVGGVRR
ncbi:hypothetical protein HK101_005911, partial [Irineochytrium annulatum]